MPRTYLRYEPDVVCGIIATPGGCAVHPSGQKVFVAAHDNINVWSTTSDTRLSYYESCLDASVSVLIHHPKMNLAAAGMSNGRVLVFDTSLPKLDLLHSFLPTNSAIGALTFSDNGSILFVGTVGSDVFAYDLIEGQGIYNLKGGHSGPITGLATMGQRRLLSSSRDKLIVLWDLDTHTKIQTLTECYTEVRSLCTYVDTKSEDSSESAFKSKKDLSHTKIERELRNDVDRPMVQSNDDDSAQECEYDWYLFAGCADNTIHAWSTNSLPPSKTIFDILSGITDSNSIACKYLDLLTRMGCTFQEETPTQITGVVDLSNALNNPEARIIHNVDTIKEAKELLDADTKVLKYMGHINKVVSEPTVSISLVRTTLGKAFDENILAALVVSAKSIELYKIDSISTVLKNAKRRQQRYARQKVEKLLTTCKIDTNAEHFNVSEAMQNHLLTESGPLLKSTVRSIQASDFLTSSILIKSPYGEKLIGAVWIPNQNSICLTSSNNYIQIYRVLTRDGTNATVRGAIAGGSGSEANVLRTSAYTYEEALEIAIPGHRNVIQNASLNSDDTLLLTCAQNEVKVWNIRRFTCITTIDLPKPIKTPTRVVMLAGNKYSVVADTGGMLGLIDNIAAEVIDLVSAHTKSVTDLQLSGGQLISASEDGFVKFWSFGISKEGELSLNLEREFDIGYAVSAVRVDGPEKHIICALYDNTVRIHFLDTLRFKLVLYGHSLPITSLAVSANAEKLITCSLDKTIRIWGLTFGECQKMLRFESPFTDIQFIRDTRLGIAASKDGRLSYWDLDSFTLISILGEGDHGSYFSRGHFGECSSLCISKTGHFVISVGHDKAIRQWIQTEDLVNAQLEAQKRLQEVMDREEENTLGWEDPNKLAVFRDGKNAGDILMEATMLVSSELNAKSKAKNADDGSGHLATYGKPPLEYLLSVMRSEIRHEVLFDALMSITVESARTLLGLLSQMLEQKYQPADFIARCAIFLITHYFRKVANTQGLAVLVQKTQRHINEVLGRQEEEARTALGCLRIMQSLTMEAI